jgi:excisionase family DNA binding protein
MTAIDSPYLNVAEAAAYLRRSSQGIYALVKRGRLKPMPGSRQLFFTRDNLDAFMLGKAKSRKATDRSCNGPGVA